LTLQANSTLDLGYNPNVGAGTMGTLTNNGNVDFRGDGQVITGLGSNASSFNNIGILDKASGTGTSSIQGNVAFLNIGTVLVQTVTLEFDPSFTTNNASANAVSIASGATLTSTAGGSSAASAVNIGGSLNLSGGTFTLGAGTTSGSGTIALTTGTLSVGASG